MDNILELKKGIYVEKNPITEKLIDSLSNYIKDAKFLTAYALEDLAEENGSIHMIYDNKNGDKKIIGHALVRPIQNDELILVYDFEEIDSYPLGDDLDIHGTLLEVLEIAHDYRGKGIGEAFVTHIKEIVNDKIILKSMNGSMGFWEKQGFNYIYSCDYEDAHWFYLNKRV